VIGGLGHIRNSRNTPRTGNYLIQYLFLGLKHLKALQAQRRRVCRPTFGDFVANQASVYPLTMPPFHLFPSRYDERFDLHPNELSKAAMLNYRSVSDKDVASIPIAQL